MPRKYTKIKGLEAEVLHIGVVLYNNTVKCHGSSHIIGIRQATPREAIASLSVYTAEGQKPYHQALPDYVIHQVIRIT